ncbi:MAG: amidase [Alphaproteobacteria bacterium]|nr:amidase [Alphaproteobacteria bacterium]
MVRAALTAVEAAAAIRSGATTAAELVAACLDHIAKHEPTVQAWQFLDRDYALAQARAADRARQAGAPLGPLHGVPIGIKDVFDTADMPTEHGSALFAGRRPRTDAFAVARLRQAGAVVLGKTVTAELAYRTPGKTRNPRDPARSPGGSSSGSAAAVAAAMVPVAIGTQTGGSTIRPASLCGVYGFKPSLGLVSRTGMLETSPTLDHVGWFARSIADLALVGDTLAAFDAEDVAMTPGSPPSLAAIAGETMPVEPKLAFVRTPVWPKAEPVVAEAFLELIEALGDRVEPVDLPSVFAKAWPAHGTIVDVELAHCLGDHEAAAAGAAMSDLVREAIQRGRGTSAVDYLAARDLATKLAGEIDDLLFAYDGIITPAAVGPAPLGLASPSDPAFCLLWTLLGVPALNLPLLETGDGLPIGVQIVGRRGADGRVLRLGRWLGRRVAAAA